MAETNRIGRAIGAVAAALYRHAGLGLLAVALLTAAGLWSARHIKVDADLASMLPRSFESVRNLEALRREFGDVGHVTVHVSGAPPDALKRYARDLAARLEKLPTVRYVEYQLPVGWLKDRALYFMEVNDLEEIHRIVAKRMAWEKIRATPGYVDIEDSPPPPLDFGPVERRYQGRQESRWTLDRGSAESYYLDARTRELVLLVKPTGSSTDVGFARKVVADVKRVVDGMDRRSYAPTLKAELCGRFTKRVDQQTAINRDLRFTTLISAVLMLLYLGLHFRRGTAVVLVFVPLVVGLIWTFGAAALLVDSLNLISAFFGAILLGMGIDNGIHLLSSYQQHRAAGVGPEEAVRRAYGSTGLGVLVAAVTTIVAFIGLGLSDFRGFSEFGRVAATGLLLVLVAYVLCLPALLGVATRLRLDPPQPASTGHSRLVGWLGRAAPVVFWLGAVATAWLATRLDRARFEYDFAKLDRQDLPSVVVDRRVDGILGRSQVPQVVLTRTEADARHVTSVLRERMKRPGSGIDFVVTSADFVPARQPEKHAIIQKILHELRKVTEDDFKDRAREQFLRLQRYRDLRPFTVHDLPLDLRRRFQARDGQTLSSFVLVFAKVSLSDGARLRALARELRGLPLPGGGTVSAAGAGMILADVLDMVFEKTPRVMTVTGLMVFLTMWVLLGSLRRATFALLPATLTVIATIGLAPLVGLQFNYLNVVMMAVLVGLGVDGGAHLVIQREAGEPLDQVVAGTGKAVLGSLVTTALGFAAVILAQHPGVRSLAELMILGLVANAVACLLVLPAVLGLGPFARGPDADGRTGPGWLTRTLATVAGAGRSPVLPAAVAALAALPLLVLLGRLVVPAVVAVVAAVLILAAVVMRRYLRTARGPAPELVIDAPAGALVALALVPLASPRAAWLVAAALLVFLLLHAGVRRLRPLASGSARPELRLLAAGLCGLVAGSVVAALPLVL